MNRAFSAESRAFTNPGALPQAQAEIAPLAHNLVPMPAQKPALTSAKGAVSSLSLGQRPRI